MTMFWQRLFGVKTVFSEPAALWLLGIVAAALGIAYGGIEFAKRTGRITPETLIELRARWKSWLWLVGGMVTPIILGPIWVMIGVLALCLLCYRDFARATGLFREKTISVCVVLGMLLTMFATLDNYSRLFFASAPLTVALIAIATIPQDRPQGYIQRIALGVLGYVLFGYNLEHVAFLSNMAAFRGPIILLLLLTSLNDVFAYCCGKLIQGPRLLPETSPNKTVAGSVGALVLTTLLTFVLGPLVFHGTSLAGVLALLTLGVGISVLGQLGDLLMSSVKRDLGLKDIGQTLPGHGGWLDRFDSLLLTAPAYFHFLSLHLGPIGADQPTRVLTGG